MNLYNISNRLMSIYQDIEENEGEVTPEIEEQLVITENDFREKIEDYAGLIKQLQNDIDACALEAKRVANVKKSKEKTLERIKRVLADAIDAYGDATKSGGKYYDLGTEKISVRHTEVCNINKDIIDNTEKQLVNMLYRLKENELLGQISFTDDFIESSANGLDREDIANITVNINIKRSLLDICDGKANDILVLLPGEDREITCDASKSKCSTVIKSGTMLTFANLVPNKSLTIK